MSKIRFVSRDNLVDIWAKIDELFMRKFSIEGHEVQPGDNSAESLGLATPEDVEDAVEETKDWVESQDYATNDEVDDKIAQAVSGLYTPKGSSAFASLPEPAEGMVGWVYNVTDGFTTTDDFVEGAGIEYGPGENIVCVETEDGYKWDVLSGLVDLSGYLTTEEAEDTYATKTELSDAIAEEVSDRDAAISDSADSVLSTVEDTYLSQTDAEADYQKRLYFSYGGTSGTAGYVQICTFTLNSTYMNRPIHLQLFQRNRETSNVYIRFSNASTVTSYTLSKFEADGEAQVWMQKTGNQTWRLIVRKSEGYDTVYVNEFVNDNSGIAVDFTGEFMGDLPTENIYEVTRVIRTISVGDGDPDDSTLYGVYIDSETGNLWQWDYS